MKTVQFILSLVIIFAAAGNSFAANLNDERTSKGLQLTPVSEIIISEQYEDWEKLDSILQRLNDPDPFVRVEAVQALGEIQKTKSLVSACGCLDDENIYVRAYAAETLGKIGQVDMSLTLSKLLAALDDPSPYVRAMIVASLGELQDKRALDSIRKLLRDEDKSVRGMAAWALSNIEKAQQ